MCFLIKYIGLGQFCELEYNNEVPLKDLGELLDQGAFEKKETSSAIIFILYNNYLPTLN